MNKIAIIGAGLAGITAAIQLKEKGYEVQIFEKEQQVGGKCKTWVHKENGRSFPFDMGATILSINFKHLLQLVRRVEAPMLNTTPYEYVNEYGEILKLKDHYWPKTSIEELLRFVQHIYTFRRKYMSKKGYKPSIPDQYKSSFAAYCWDNDLEGVKQWFDLPLAAWGYKNQNTLPAWYVFGEIDLFGFLGLIMTVRKGRSPFVRGLSDGIGNLISNLVEAYQLEVILNTEIKAIHRFEDQVVLESDVGMDSFDKVIVSNPALIAKLSNPSRVETAILDELRYAPYASILCTLDVNLNKKLMIGPNLARIKGLKMIAAPYQGLPYAICYFSIGKIKSILKVEEQLMEALKELGIGLVAIHKTMLWPNYFPHLASFAAYEALLATQAQNRTLYIGSINQFESTKAVVATTKALIDTHFPDLIPVKKEWFTTIKNWNYWFYGK